MDIPQIYLVTPSSFELGPFAAALPRILDAAPVACLRLALGTRDEGALTHAADGLRDIAHARDIPLVIAEHIGLVERLGLDGVHLGTGRGLRAARKALGSDAIIGAHCGQSRHEGLSAGEAGADYISFGPMRPDALSGAPAADPALFAWWSEMIELPVVAEGGLSASVVEALAPHTDFFALSDEIWDAPDPADALGVYARLLAAQDGG